MKQKMLSRLQINPGSAGYLSYKEWLLREKNQIFNWLDNKDNYSP